MSKSNILIYLLRRDLRVSDNPILHTLASGNGHGFTHLLPLFVVPPHQIEVSGFINDGSQSPYPEARSVLGRFWRCGPHRADFLVSSIWDLKESLESLESGLVLRIGPYKDVLGSILDGLKEKGHQVGAVWMTSDEGTEEKEDESSISSACSGAGVEFRLWDDEKYFIDDRDVKLDQPGALPDVFTTYRKMMEPLRERPRTALPSPPKASLPSLPPAADIPPQPAPFEIPSSYDKLHEAALSVIRNFIPDPPAVPEGAISAHPFRGGETYALRRLDEIIQSGTVFRYKDTRNGLLGANFSTKLSAYLALGNITARQVHEALVHYEDGREKKYADAEGYGNGENEGTKAVRFELLWRDYMRLCNKKFSYKLFRLSGFRNDHSPKWKSPKDSNATEKPDQEKTEVEKKLQRFFAGTTGMGLIDASQRELIHTGYTSNRARQNVASFLAKHLGIDWRYGAEWYEMLLIDYDVSSNWSNWQYVAGVGNDPRGEARIFNPVKQAFDYDKEGKYVKTWVPEVRELEKLEHVFQASTTPKEDWDRLKVKGLSMVEDPIKRIDFNVDGKPSKHAKRPFDRRRKDGRIRSNANLTAKSPPVANHHPDNINPIRDIPGGPQRQVFQFDAPRHPRGNFRGGRGGRGGSGSGSGYRGRGQNGYNAGGYRGGRGGYSQGYGFNQVASTQWSPSSQLQSGM
ncbi:DNA photolyase, FAD-binding/Cryptochrome [Xylariales sp. PMI_506]|nr:DNA photolyase, FAD-binding/Cryptochrome [Xylariales sp. PMI_506]